MHPDEGTARLITVAVLLVQAMLVVASVRIVAFLNSSAVVVEVAIVGVLAIALIVVVALAHQARTPILIVRGLLLAGGVFLLLMLTFDRKSLDAEPGDASVLEA